ncbi:REP-associated tyrosine transposase [Legionella rowbothamii]|uniref:REP-associated tyrosine transposase n=1 Tax=Legionella rowbothamii TaxID=96229 RepID=UPI0010566D01|nr:transposase [Legionella rowbothamii]
MRYRRIIIPGASYFFTVNLQNRKSKLLTENIDKLRFSFQNTMQYYPFGIEAIVVLPDHLHMIMSLPLDDGNYSVRWNCIKGTFSKQLPANESISNIRKNKRERGIWQKRFWEHLIRDEKDFEHHANYIHYNPVKHRYVVNPSDWEYSSIHRFIQKGILRNDWGCDDKFNLLDFGEMG